MAIWGPLIGAAGSLLGGLFGRRQRNKELRQQDPEYIRQRAENAGFNPLLFTNAAFRGVGYSPVFGQSIASAASILGSGISEAHQREQQLALQRSELELENRRLDEIVRRSTLSPTVPGIYGGSGAQARGFSRVVSSDDYRGDASVDDYRLSIGAPSLIPGRATVTNAWETSRGPYFSDPTSPDAETVETRYGELPGWVYGANNLFLRDPAYNRSLKRFAAHTGRDIYEVNDWVSHDPSRLHYINRYVAGIDRDIRFHNSGFRGHPVLGRSDHTAYSYGFRPPLRSPSRNLGAVRRGSHSDRVAYP